MCLCCRYRRTARRTEVEYVPLLRLLIRGILSIVVAPNGGSSVRNESPAVHSASPFETVTTRKRGVSETGHLSASQDVGRLGFGPGGLCDPVQNIREREANLPLEGLLWRKMCVIDDPTHERCETLMKVAFGPSTLSSSFHNFMIQHENAAKHY